MSISKNVQNLKRWKGTIIALENAWMTNIESTLSIKKIQFLLLAYSIANTIPCNSVRKEVQTQILAKKAPKNVPKLSLNMQS